MNLGIKFSSEPSRRGKFWFISLSRKVGKALMGTEMCWRGCQGVNAGGKDCSTWGDDLCSCWAEPPCNAGTWHPCLLCVGELSLVPGSSPLFWHKDPQIDHKPGGASGCYCKQLQHDGKRHFFFFFKMKLDLVLVLPWNPDKEGLQT